MTATKKLVAGYSRVSTETQAEKGTSLEEQRQQIEAYCAREGWELVDFYEDGGVSGSSMIRPELTRLLEDARQKRFEAVLFVKLDRLGRSIRDIFNLYHRLNEELKIDLVCTQDAAVNTTGPVGRALLGMLATFAEFERGMIRVRTQEGRRIKWEKGEQVVGTLPLGYKKGKPPEPLIVIDEERAEIYRLIVSLYLDRRLSCRAVADELTARGIESPATVKKQKSSSGKWDNKSVRNILRNTAYSGEQTYNRKQTEWKTGGAKGRYQRRTKELKPESENIVVHFPPLISPERFQQIQDQLEHQKIVPKRRFAEYPDAFMLDGMIFCGECGTAMRKFARTKKNGTVTYLRYTCYFQKAGQRAIQGKRKTRCLLRAVDAMKVDAEVFDKISDVLTRPATYLEQWFKDVDTDELEKKIALLEKKAAALSKELAAGFDYIRRAAISEASKAVYEASQAKTQATLDKISHELTNARKTLELTRGKLSRFEQFKETIGSASRWRTTLALQEFLANLSFQEKKALVQAMISPARIPENGGRVEVRYIRPTDFMDGDELAKLPKKDRDKPLMDERVAVEVKFDIDLEKIQGIIGGLDKDKLISGTPSCSAPPSPAPSSPSPR